jgi:hypothetical protein
MNDTLITPPHQQSELVVIPPKDDGKGTPPPNKKQKITPSGKKNSKGALLSIVFFLILTLPVAVYYGSQKYKQITEQRGRAAEGPYPCDESCQPDHLDENGFCGSTGNQYWCQNVIGDWGVLKSCLGGSCKDPYTYDAGNYCLDTHHGRNCDAGVRCSTSPDPRCTDVTPTERPGHTHTPTPTGPTNTPTATPTPTGPTNTPTDSPTPTEQTNTPTNTSAPTQPPSQPGRCDASCGSDNDCELAFYCVSVNGINRCRNNDCPEQSNCRCSVSSGPTSTPRPRTYYTATPTRAHLIAEVATATPTSLPTPKVPVSGTIDMKAVMMTVGAIFFVALGIIL